MKPTPRLDKPAQASDNFGMDPTPTEDLREFTKDSKAFLKQIRQNPAKAKAFLLEVGILVRSKASPSGVKLAKRYRSAS
jgi:hypothetical protein